MGASDARFERRGGPPDLPVVFADFVLKVLRGRSLDDQFDIESADGEFPDFGLYRDLVLIEMKHLEQEQQDRVQSVLEEKALKDEMPIIFGAASITIDKETFSNADEILQAIMTKLARSVESVLSKANRQFRGYRERHPRKNAVNICLIVNSKIPEFTPELVAKAVHSKMKAREDGAQRFESIDVVLYISEKHFTPLPGGRAAYPVMIYEGMGAIENKWKMELVNRIVHAWSLHRTGTPMEATLDMNAFAPVEDVPDSMSRSEAWLLEYARRPYLRDLSVEQLRVEFQRAMAINSLTFLIGSWEKPPQRFTAEGLRHFQHVIAELGRRALDVREMAAEKLTDRERKVVFQGLPGELVEQLSGNRSSTD